MLKLMSLVRMCIKAEYKDTAWGLPTFSQYYYYLYVFLCDADIFKFNLIRSF